ncbi:MAG: hypothetical protein CVU05_10315 [Bacteroidetes bacterium HGW-Bacteroidetes-21]|jgi:tetratricopeptide (TPR) repeat protein|nr:MAG: hypothetical protein CVU05_10315 [Bacteroidetes bacterium HGW-Bacteroidetes-21]
MAFVLRIFLLLCVTTYVSAQSQFDFFYKALSANENKYPDSAFYYIDKSLSFEWDSVIALQRAKWDAAAGNYQKALDEVVEVIEKGNINATLYAARYYAFMGEIEKSLSNLNTYIHCPGSLPHNIIRTDSSFSAFTDLPSWESFWLTAKSDELMELRADISYRLIQKDYNSLFDVIDNALLKYPDASELHYYRFLVFYYTENYSGALKSINKAMKLLPDNAEYYYVRAGLYKKTKSYSKAIKEYQKYRDLYPYNIYVLKEMTQTAMDAENADAAIQYAEEFLVYFHNDINLLFTYALALEMKKEYRMAIENYTKVLYLDRDHADSYYRRGMCYFELGEFEKATNEFTLTMDLRPRNGEVFYYRGLARLNNGDKIGACRDFERAKIYGNFNADGYLMKLCNEK